MNVHFFSLMIDLSEKYKLSNIFILKLLLKVCVTSTVLTYRKHIKRIHPMIQREDNEPSRINHIVDTGEV